MIVEAKSLAFVRSQNIDRIAEERDLR